MITYKKLLDSGDEIRARLMTIMHKDPKSMQSICKEIVVSPATLRDFLEEKGKTERFTLFKIYGFVLQREKELGIE